jgi:hypothetical protein
MKKVLYFAALLLGTTVFTACQKEDIENTATVSMAGQWYCTVDAVDDAGNPITKTLDGQPNSGEDYFGLGGRTFILTYNTSANSASEMWVDNLGIGNFSADYAAYWKNYGFYPTYTIKTKVSIDQNALTFRSTESENFGEGYQWWRTDVKLDEKGDTIWSEEDPTKPETVDVMFHEEKAMPVTIEGKILKGAGRQNNGSPADSIIFFVTYKDDPWFPDDGYTKYKVSGIRYSGLVEND